MKILTILGARPQFIKAGTVSREIAKYNVTEWVELVEYGYNVLVGAEREKIIESYQKHSFNDNYNLDFYGGGVASRKIVKALMR